MAVPNASQQLMDDVCRHSSYFGNLTLSEVENLLQSTGDWLICKVRSNDGSKIHGNFTLFVKKKDSSTKMIVMRITSSSSLKQIGCPEFFGGTFQTLDRLIQYLKGIRLPTSTRLLRQIVRPNWLMNYGLVAFDEKKRLRSGNFGTVYKGRIFWPVLKYSMEVAIKTVDEDEPMERNMNRQALLLEAKATMGCHECVNVVKCFGVCTDLMTMQMVVQLCCGGSLDAHLKSHGLLISHNEKVYYMRSIAEGIQYVHKSGYLHRDIAARNVLISSHGLLKISDFGLACSIDAAEQGDERIILKHFPLRWSAPELITRSPKYSIKSDSWAYGIVAYEIFMNGEFPWPNDELDVIKSNIKKRKMPSLEKIVESKERNLMNACWSLERNDRPTFDTIVAYLGEPSIKDLEQECGYSIFNRDGVQFICPASRISNEIDLLRTTKDSRLK